MIASVAQMMMMMISAFVSALDYLRVAVFDGEHANDNEQTFIV